VLSACESGSSGLSALVDEHGGLPAALQLAGADTVVATLWPVSEPVTALFVHTFYAKLASGHDARSGEKSMTVAGSVWAAADRLRKMTSRQARQELLMLARQTASDRAAFDLEAFAATLDDSDDPPFAQPWFCSPFFVTGSGQGGVQ
jgi:CHAT domain-containing protein